MTVAVCCKKCFLGSDHPGIDLDAQGLCNLCRLEVSQDLIDNFHFTEANYREFLASKPRPQAPYDCLFMYSGGKDSTYMLDRFVNEEQRRVLAYTFKIPFESEHAAQNIENIRTRIRTDYFIDSDDDNVRKLMRHVFNGARPTRPGRYLDEKLPCMTCRSLYVIRAINYAFKRRIPFIIFCADPQQIVTTESDVQTTVRNFYRTAGRELTEEIFGQELEEILFAPAHEVPKIIFPYISMRHSYDPGRMVTELKAKGLYNSSPLETHCSLFPLLNYYSFKHYGCSFYKLNMASERRNAREPGSGKSTFSIRFERSDDMLETERDYERVVMDIATQTGDPREQRVRLENVFARMKFPPQASAFLTDKFMDMHTIAADLGIELEAVGSQEPADNQARSDRK